MKLKLDENLPESLVQTLSTSGHDVGNVRIENIIGQDDKSIWEAAQESGRILITQDLDFSDVRKFLPGTHHGLMLVRLRVPGRLALTGRIGAAFASEQASSWARCFILLTDNKLRVHRPSS